MDSLMNSSGTLAREQTTLDVLIREPQLYNERATGAITTATVLAAEAMQAAKQAPDRFPASLAEAAQPDPRISCAPYGADDDRT
ncbi:hypothetical protein [Bradyrhizobium sp. USDA 4451]